MSKMIEYNSNLKDRARELRRNATKAERILWEEVLSKKKTGYKFTRQKPVGSFIADFYCSKLKLVIELDGESHSGKKEYDLERDIELNKLGITTLRLTNDDVLKNIDKAQQTILNSIKRMIL